MSLLTITDLYEKSGYAATTINIIKSFIGLGVLAMPSCYKEVGFIIASILIFICAYFNAYTIHLQAISRHMFNKNIKSFSNLAYKCY